MINHSVVVAIKGIVSGVDVFSINLVSTLRKRGIEARIIMTGTTESWRLPISNIPVDGLSVKRKEPWPQRWKKFIRYLESQAPCIYLPNYDLKYSCVLPKLSENVLALGIVHSDDLVHYEHAGRMGKYWNGMVSVSDAITNQLRSFGKIPRRTKKIPYGVEVPEAWPERQRSKDQPLKIIYSGRLSQYQKNVFQLAEIFNKLDQMSIPFNATIIGDGPDRIYLQKQCEKLISEQKVNFLGIQSNQDVVKILGAQDCIILTSDFEGMPICVLEGMSRGCIPVVSGIRSGIPEVIREGHDGFVVPSGDAHAHADRLRQLFEDLQLRETMSYHAYQTARNRFSLDRMADEYLVLFEQIIKDAKNGSYRRPKGAIPVPPSMHIGWKEHLPQPIRRMVKFTRKVFRRIQRPA